MPYSHKKSPTTAAAVRASFVAQLVAPDNIERAMMVLRTTRQNHHRYERSSPALTRPTSFSTDPPWVDKIMEAFGHQQAADYSSVVGNLLMTQVTQTLGSSPTGHTVLNNKAYQALLATRMPSIFGGWPAHKWTSLARSIQRWSFVVRSDTWGYGRIYGLALLLPTSWIWNVKAGILRDSMKEWEGFVNELPTASPNLFILAQTLNDYALSVLQGGLVDLPLLAIELQAAGALESMAPDLLRKKTAFVGDLATRNITFFDNLTERPLTYTRTIEMLEANYT